MKIVSINTFGGTVFEPLMHFVEREAVDTDVFCFQEVMDDTRGLPWKTPSGFRANLLQELSTRLSGFRVLFSSMLDLSDIDPNDRLFMRNGLATFVRQGMNVISNRAFSLGDEASIGQNALSVTLRVRDVPFTICNVHGMSNPGDKLDTSARLVQSQKILAHMQGVAGERIIMGDFNLLPETESVRMFERAGFYNLIKDYDIQTTRGAHHRVLHPEFGISPMTFQEFADFTFVSSGVSVQAFSVPDIPVSDHLPMILSYS